MEAKTLGKIDQKQKFLYPAQKHSLIQNTFFKPWLDDGRIVMHCIFFKLIFFCLSKLLEYKNAEPSTSMGSLINN